MKNPLLLVLILLILCVASFGQVPQASKVVMVMLENKAYSSVTSTSMPYVYALTGKQGANLTQFYAEVHPSIGNYFATTMGQIYTTSDGYTGTITADNIVRHFLSAGVTFKSYAESLPSAGYTGGDKYPYSLHHNPFAYFSDLRNSSLKTTTLVPFNQFATDLANGDLPQFSMVVPNMVHNAHDCPNGQVSGCSGKTKLQEADKWIKANFSALLNTPDFQPGGRGVFIVWFDESASTDTAYGGGHIFEAIIGPNVQPGTYPAHHNHYDLLRTILSMYGMSTGLGKAGSASTITDIWKAPTAPPAPSACATDPNFSDHVQVAVCSPTTGSTAQSPVHVVAAASAPTGTKYIQVYVDGVKFGTYYTANLTVDVPMAAGSHRITVQAPDNSGVMAKNSVYITVN